MNYDQYKMLFDADLRAKNEEWRAICQGITVDEVIMIWEDLKSKL